MFWYIDSWLDQVVWIWYEGCEALDIRFCPLFVHGLDEVILNLLIRHVKGIFLNLRASMNLIGTNRCVDGCGSLLIFMTDLSDTGKNRLSNHEIFSSFQLRVSRPGLQNKHCQIWFYGSNPEAVMCPNCLFWHYLYHLHSEVFEDIADLNSKGIYRGVQETTPKIWDSEQYLNLEIRLKLLQVNKQV